MLCWFLLYNNMWYIYKVEYYSAIKRKELSQW